MGENEHLRVGRATLESDGEHTWLESDAPPSHPALLAPTDGPLPPAEAYKWDLCGHLVLRGVMDPAWIADALHAIDSNPNPDHPQAEGETRPLANRFRQTADLHRMVLCHSRAVAGGGRAAGVAAGRAFLRRQPRESADLGVTPGAAAAPPRALRTDAREPPRHF